MGGSEAFCIALKYSDDIIWPGASQASLHHMASSIQVRLRGRKRCLHATNGILNQTSVIKISSSSPKVNYLLSPLCLSKSQISCGQTEQHLFTLR